MASTTGTERADSDASASSRPPALAAEVVDNVDVLVFRRVLKPDGRVEYPWLSAAAARVLCIPPERVGTLGSTGIRPLLHPDDRALWMAAFERSAMTLEPVEVEVREPGPGSGAMRWIRTSARPRREPDGDIVWDCVAADVTAQKLAEEERARLAAIVGASGDAIYSWAPDGTITSWNRAAEGLFGYAAVEAMGRHFRMLVPPERHSVADEVIEKLLAGQTFPQFETVRVHRDGTRIDVSLTVSPVKDAAGRVTAVATIARDIRERRAAEEALRLAEQRFRTTLSSIGDGVIATDRGGRVTFLNAVAEALTGWRADDAAGRPLTEVFRIVNEHTRAPVQNPVERVFESGGIVGLANHTVLIGRSGREVPIADSAAPIRGSAGGIVGAVLVFRDVSAERAEEEQRELMLRELDHRVKNTLTLVQSVVRQTLRGSGSTDELKAAVEGRITALAGAHRLLFETGWREADLGALVEGVMAPYLAGAGDARMVAVGPPVRLSPAAAPTLAMVLHELGTNAAKYGALSGPEGRVELSWRVAAAGGSVELVWRESGGPPVEPPARRGFGTAMIDRAVTHQLGGEAELCHDPAGLVCRITLPAEVATVEEAAHGAV